MFRKMRRFKQELSQEECIEVLVNAPRGVLAVHGENGYPYAIPMNHFYIEGKLYFHSAKEGHKLDAIALDDKVSFCVMDEGFRKDGEWALNIRSVVIFGKLRKLESNQESMEILRKLGQKHYPTPESVEKIMKSDGGHVQMLELCVDHMSGKLVNES
ncbi:MAG: pyridoxamine 5'-phosphate oxidase family protein [Eubacteriales bacterium]